MKLSSFSSFIKTLSACLGAFFLLSVLAGCGIYRYPSSDITYEDEALTADYPLDDVPYDEAAATVNHPLEQVPYDDEPFNDEAATVNHPTDDVPYDDEPTTVYYAPLNPSPDRGVIRVYVCSRGCYQYVLETGRSRFYPLNLADAFKEDGLRVVFEAEIERGTTTIKRAGPDDRPIPIFEARNVFIRNMRRG